MTTAIFRKVGKDPRVIHNLKKSLSGVETVLLNTARNYKVLKTVQRTTRYYKELQDTSNEVPENTTRYL